MPKFADLKTIASLVADVKTLAVAVRGQKSVIFDVRNSGGCDLPRLPFWILLGEVYFFSSTLENLPDFDISAGITSSQVLEIKGTGGEGGINILRLCFAINNGKFLL